MCHGLKTVAGRMNLTEEICFLLVLQSRFVWTPRAHPCNAPPRPFRSSSQFRLRTPNPHEETVWVQSFLKFCTGALERSSMESESTVFRRHLKTRLFLIWVLVSLVAALAGTPLPPAYFFFYFRCTFLLFPVSFFDDITVPCRIALI